MRRGRIYIIANDFRMFSTVREVQPGNHWFDVDTEVPNPANATDLAILVSETSTPTISYLITHKCVAWSLTNLEAV